MPTGSYEGVVDGEVGLGCSADEERGHDICNRWSCDGLGGCGFVLWHCIALLQAHGQPHNSFSVLSGRIGSAIQIVTRHGS